MKKKGASVGAIPPQVEEIMKKTFEKLFQKIKYLKDMEVDVQKNENDFFLGICSKTNIHAGRKR